jgi:hypothetical protein
LWIQGCRHGNLEIDYRFHIDDLRLNVLMPRGWCPIINLKSRT